MSTSSGWHVDADGNAIVDDEDEATYDEAFGPGERSGHVGRLVEDDEGTHTDTTKDAVAHETVGDHGGYSAEEAAMHVEDDSEVDVELVDLDDAEDVDAGIDTGPDGTT